MIKKLYDDGQEIYTLPGGSQDPGETLDQTVIREVYDETAAKVQVVGLLNVYEHSRQSGKEPGVIKHKIEFAFLCKVDEHYKPKMGKSPDPHQIAVEWIYLNSLNKLKLHPSGLSEILKEITLPEQSIYLGNIAS